MASAKKYFWLKLKEDFFRQKEVKKLRKIAGGDTFTIIYLKLQLLSMKTDGLLEFTGLEENFAEELALEIDEDPDNVAVTMNFLTKCGLIEIFDDREIFLTKVPEITGKESESAERVRKYREKTKVKSLHCNVGVTNCNTEIEIEKEIELNKDNNIDQSIFDEDKVKLRKNIKTYIDIIVKSTGLDRLRVEQVINPSLFRNYNLDELLEKISESKFLQGLEKSKPKISHFTTKKMLDLVLADNYKDKVTKENEFTPTEYSDDGNDELFKKWGL